MTKPPAFDCREAFRRVEDYVDRELSAEEMELVRTHLETCEICAREFSFEAFVLTQARAKLARIDVPETLKARIARALTSDADGPAAERPDPEGEAGVTPEA